MDTVSAHDLIETVRSAILVLDRDLQVTLANRAFYQTFATTTESTLGRRLYDLGDGRWDIPALRTLLEEVIPARQAVEAFEVEHDFPGIGQKTMRVNGRQVHRSGNQVEHMLLAIDDVTAEKAAKRDAERAALVMQSIVDTTRDPMLVLEGDMTVVTANRAFLGMFSVSAGALTGKRLHDLGESQWNVPALHNVLDRVVPDSAPVEGFEIEDEFPGLGRRVFQLNARKVVRPGNHVTRLLVAFEDVTEARQRERHKDLLAAELAHRIKNSLQIIASFVSFELRRAAGPCVEGYRTIQTRIAAIAELYEVIARSSALGPVAIDAYLAGLAASLRTSLLGQASGIEIVVSADPLLVTADHAVPIGLLVNELVTNAVKYAFPGGRGRVSIGFGQQDDHVVLTIADDGVGIGTTVGGSGMGSRFIEAFVRQISGSLAVASSAIGTTVSVRLPREALA